MLMDANDGNTTFRKVALGLLIMRVGFWLLVLGAILPVIAIAEALSQRRNLAENPKLLIGLMVCFLPGSVLDLLGRFLCCRLPSSWAMLRPFALTSALLPAGGIGLVSLVVLDQYFGRAWLPEYAARIGQFAWIIGWISFAEFLRRLARQVNDERSFWRAITVQGIWVVCAVLSVAMVLVPLPLAGIAVVVLGLVLLTIYEQLLSSARVAVLAARVQNPEPTS